MLISVKARTVVRQWKRRMPAKRKVEQVTEIEKKQTKRKRAIIKVMKLMRKKAKQ